LQWKRRKEEKENMTVIAQLISVTKQFNEPVAPGTQWLTFIVQVRNVGTTFGEIRLPAYDTDKGIILTTSPLAVWADPGATYDVDVMVENPVPNYSPWHLAFGAYGIDGGGSPISIDVAVAVAPKKATGLGISIYPIVGTVPFTVYITGKLTDATTYLGINGKSINLYRNGVKIATGTTAYDPVLDSDGIVNFEDNITVAGSYAYYIEFAGDSEYEGCGELVCR
jgi:hypothetical protein